MGDADIDADSRPGEAEADTDSNVGGDTIRAQPDIGEFESHE